MVGGEVVITGKTNCVDCTTNDSCVSNDETLITQTTVIDPADTSANGVYIELVVTIPNVEVGGI